MIVLFFMAGCAITTTITSPQKEVWTIVSKKDALVKMEQDGVKIEVDNRGKLGIVESIFGVLIMKTDVKLSNKEGSQ